MRDQRKWELRYLALKAKIERGAYRKKTEARILRIAREEKAKRTQKKKKRKKSKEKPEPNYYHDKDFAIIRPILSARREKTQP